VREPYKIENIFTGELGHIGRKVSILGSFYLTILEKNYFFNFGGIATA
jgi:hypothetical protein